MYADEIDKNRVRSVCAKRIREIIGAYRLQFTGIELNKILFEFSQRVASRDIEELFDRRYDDMIDNYIRWIETAERTAFENLSTYKVKGLKIAVIDTKKSCPVYTIIDKLRAHKDAPFDIIVVVIRSEKYTKMEFRTQTDTNVLQLAKAFGGGGHALASGATIHGKLHIEDLLRTIEYIKI
jgi:oligoribonuclease NrnB/cAMP/cGMP phosphodiesterase (DHH superfamily)